MSGKKNQTDLLRRQRDISFEVRRRKGEKVEFIVADIAQRLYLRPSTIWRDLKKFAEREEIENQSVS